jgi:hypothetical protein
MTRQGKIVLAVVVVLASVVGCSPKARQASDAAVDTKPPCVGLQCQVDDCGTNPPTTISGTVFAPNGQLPLYNVGVFVPNAPLEPLTVGVSCDRCGTPVSGSPVVIAQSDYMGKFQLVNAPSGTNIPLVIQLGKWRREVTIPQVLPCQDNHLSDPNMTRLPKKRSEGNMPKIAVTLGGCDQISCLLPKVGIDPSEFGVAGQNRTITFYSTPSASNGPPGMTSATPFWSSVSELSKYDIVILSCECEEAPDSKDASSYQAVAQYLAMGGRIFTTDFQYTWYRYSPDPGLMSIGSIQGGAPSGDSPIKVDASFPKGKALADWMNYTMMSSSYGQVTPDEVFDNFLSANPMKSQTFGSSPAFPSSTQHPRFMTINTPVGLPVDQQCGKAVHLDAHINELDTIDSSFPAGCASPIRSGEAAFAYFFFDLANCIQDDSQPPIL